MSQVARVSVLLVEWSKFVKSEPGVDLQYIHIHLLETMDLLGYTLLYMR